MSLITSQASSSENAWMPCSAACWAPAAAPSSIPSSPSEHHWAVPLRDAVARAGGFRISDGFISLLDLVEIGLLTAEEAKELHEAETTAVGARQ
jgi:hypothetical protein